MEEHQRQQDSIHAFQAEQAAQQQRMVAQRQRQWDSIYAFQAEQERIGAFQAEQRREEQRIRWEEEYRIPWEEQQRIRKKEQAKQWKKRKRRIIVWSIIGGVALITPLYYQENNY
jgi:hypothetical protein